VACQVLVWLGRDLDVVRTAAEGIARDADALTSAWREAGIPLGDAADVVAALVAAFGDEVALVGLRVGRSGEVQAAVHLPGRARSTVMVVRRTDAGWVVPDPSGSA
jgi:hypothetical protein